MPDVFLQATDSLNRGQINIAPEFHLPANPALFESCESWRCCLFIMIQLRFALSKIMVKLLLLAPIMPQLVSRALSKAINAPTNPLQTRSGKLHLSFRKHRAHLLSPPKVGRGLLRAPSPSKNRTCQFPGMAQAFH